MPKHISAAATTTTTVSTTAAATTTATATAAASTIAMQNYNKSRKSAFIWPRQTRIPYVSMNGLKTVRKRKCVCVSAWACVWVGVAPGNCVWWPSALLS